MNAFARPSPAARYSSRLVARPLSCLLVSTTVVVSVLSVSGCDRSHDETLPTQAAVIMPATPAPGDTVAVAPSVPSATIATIATIATVAANNIPAGISAGNGGSATGGTVSVIPNAAGAAPAPAPSPAPAPAATPGVSPTPVGVPSPGPAVAPAPTPVPAPGVTNPSNGNGVNPANPADPASVPPLPSTPAPLHGPGAIGPNPSASSPGDDQPLSVPPGTKR